MKNLLINLLKPNGPWARWLIFLTLAAMLGLGWAGYFEILKEYTDTEVLSFTVGDYSISVYMVLKALLIIILVFWTAAIAADFAESRLGHLGNIRSANRSLYLKITQILIYMVALLVTLDILGINLTALTVFSGAFGIGLGFGLQKIASSFVSGLILLFEKSVEQDHLVEMSGGISGFVRKISARFTLVETFDGKEIMIPNEDFITSSVTNWTYSNTRGRIEIAMWVAYGSDLQKASDLMLEAARAHPLCISEPEPKCYLRGFGDSSVNFILHFWLNDVTAGRWQAQSDVLFDIWRKFKDADIEIPFPQRDLHIKSSEITEALKNG